MTGWLRLASRYGTHPKLDGLTEAQAWRWTRLLLHCVEQETDGYVSPAALKRTGLVASRKKLLALRLLEEKDGELFVHDFLDYNPSKAERDAERERWREYKAASRSKADVHGGHQGGRTPRLQGGVKPLDARVSSSKDLRKLELPPSSTTDSREGGVGNLDPSTLLLVSRLLARLPPDLEPGKADYIRGAAARLPESVTAGVLELLEAGGHVRDPVAYVIGALTRELRERGQSGV